jgi:hypothetical protein
MQVNMEEIEKYFLDRLPDGRVPTFADLDRALEQPEEADPLAVAYLNARPQLKALLQRTRELNERHRFKGL